MPKQRKYDFKRLQGTSTQARPSPSRAESSNAEATSVNEKLDELRKAGPQDAGAKKRELEAIVNQRSVPPDLRGILGVPDSAPPRARAGVRNYERIRTPGPAPPSSWVRRRWAPVSRRGKAKRGVVVRNRPDELFRFGKLAGLDGLDDRSLTHFTLKLVAQQWDSLDEEDYPALMALPLRLRLRLLSYLAVYGEVIGIAAFKALTQGSDPVTVLDLAGLVGYGTLTLPRLTQVLRVSQEKASEESADDVADSWEEVEAEGSSGLSASLHSYRSFSQLTHLCLSHPPQSILWRDLLNFAKHTPSLTHLSLAYWPRPTLTPNLATSTVSNQRGLEVSAGGSHFYSELDQDLSEPLSLLRQLSGNLLRLQWLDLEGNAQWSPAVAKAYGGGTRPARGDWVDGERQVLSILTQSWRNVTYLRCAQGWLPGRPGMRALLGDSELRERRLVQAFVNSLATSVHDVESVDMAGEKTRAQLWVEVEVRLRKAGETINGFRRAAGCGPVTVDYGWTQSARGRVVI